MLLLDFVCFDIAACPGCTIPSLFSSFSSNEAEMHKSRRPNAFGGNSPKVLSVKFSGVITVINTTKWSCCLDT